MGVVDVASSSNFFQRQRFYSNLYNNVAAAAAAECDLNVVAAAVARC